MPMPSLPIVQSLPMAQNLLFAQPLELQGLFVILKLIEGHCTGMLSQGHSLCDFCCDRGTCTDQ